ncbi:hypothetical protein GCM10007981_01230 [Thermocladium modestius]|uniref:Uncharacterized protein n=1 Tax=Thermocladium modestius TaxID=62609 RepID=A0A830GVE6_9CREN|nr:hypothetical protein [Thermocladium modestius]GGP19063.1 hypothetical protein GCM10007981_01230 [Thermocladium modestius]
MAWAKAMEGKPHPLGREGGWNSLSLSQKASLGRCIEALAAQRVPRHALREYELHNRRSGEAEVDLLSGVNGAVPPIQVTCSIITGKGR